MPDLLRDQLFSSNPYADFDADAYPPDLQGWGSQHPIFERLLAELRPRRVIEVGTWKGASALHMAECLRRLGIEAEIVCIDTWLGSLEFWKDKQDPDRYLSLNLRNGYPSVYYQFLANVLKTGMQALITPFPQTARIGARWLTVHGVQAELIYIDASHEEEEVLSDLLDFWPLVAPGGVLLGDDHDEYWPGVRSAVARFTRQLGLQPEVDDGKWLLRKPLDWDPARLAVSSQDPVSLATSVRFEVISEQLVKLLNRTDQNTALADQLGSAQQRLHELDRWFSHISKTRTWRWVARRVIARRGTPWG
ncbi:class I SAM-dependent methyltransferase [uncultured Thiodictyon sp.]|uniref:class I SAM-dependent methyltransferase n=1 Tax=uncultured Thiodictyon sp. TaxID=1846217 RepID=UPI0025FB4BE7|nr:class I SAM-dependent methyltransferase [uncultured Thiodictyon sp.]